MESDTKAEFELIGALHGMIAEGWAFSMSRSEEVICVRLSDSEGAVLRTCPIKAGPESLAWVIYRLCEDARRGL